MQHQHDGERHCGLTDRLESACRQARNARVGQLLTDGHSAMMSDLAAGDPVHVSTQSPLGDQHSLLPLLDEFVQQCRHDAGTLAYKLPSCRVRYSLFGTHYSVLSTAHSSSSTASSAGCTLDEQHRHVYVAVPMSECIQSFLLLLSFIPIVTISCQCFTAYFVLLMDATKLLFLVHTGYFTAIRKARPVKTLYISTINTFP